MYFSIIIPTCNRSKSLLSTLSSISKTSRKKNQIEVIVVDNSSIKKEAEEVRKYIKIASKWFNISYFYLNRGGPSPARNLGVKKSKHDYVIFIDDDTIIPKNFIRNFERAWVNNRNVKMIGGKVIPKLSYAKPKFVNIGFEWVFAQKDLGNRILELNYPDFIFSANMSVHLGSRDKNNGIFNENLGRRHFLSYCIFGEDIEICWRFQLEGRKIVYDPRIHVLNVVASDRNKISYYWQRIINGGVERRLINHELKKAYRNYEEHPYKTEINHNSRIFLKNVIFGRHNNHSFLEDVAYLFGYHLLGGLMILYIKLKLTITGKA